MRRVAKIAVLPVPSPTTMPDCTKLDGALGGGLLEGGVRILRHALLALIDRAPAMAWATIACASAWMRRRCSSPRKLSA